MVILPHFRIICLYVANFSENFYNLLIFSFFDNFLANSCFFLLLSQLHKTFVQNFAKKRRIIYRNKMCIMCITPCITNKSHKIGGFQCGYLFYLFLLFFLDFDSFCVLCTILNKLLDNYCKK